ncbi:PqqD family protein [Phocaeicola abscessus]|uniref:PqqD family protein n=1 Tax=Phocaeicola abscessus TaxID=555313 RepID=UPI000385EE60|nr:PqqD family protein [Phocaeicola abscessus]EPT33952.1 PqqD family protein [Bacteroidetes bacterium oral taxon 272 str. F0290]
MRIKNGFVLRKIGDKEVVIGEGIEQINFNKLIALNETAAFLWKELAEKDFTEKEAADLLIEEYDVTEDVAAKDVGALIARWKTIGLIDD